MYTITYSMVLHKEWKCWNVEMLCTRLSHRKKARHSTGQYNVVQMILGYLRAEGGVKNTVPSAWQRGLGWWRRCIMRSLTRGAAARPCSTPSWGGVLHVDPSYPSYQTPFSNTQECTWTDISPLLQLGQVDKYGECPHLGCLVFWATMMKTTTMMMMTMMMICTDCPSKILWVITHSWNRFEW